MLNYRNDGNAILQQPTDKEKIANIIPSLNSNKASGHNGMPYRILFLLKKMKFGSNWQVGSTTLS